MTKADQAIKENIKKEHTVNTFFNHVLVDIENEEDYHCWQCYESAIDDICHIWKGPQFKGGYGAFTVYSKENSNTKHNVVRVRAHRFAYAVAYGFEELPTGVVNGNGDQIVLNHLCHNKLCVNPMHLEPITDRENRSPEKRKPKNG